MCLKFGKKVEGNNCDLIHGTIQAFTRKHSGYLRLKKPQKILCSVPSFEPLSSLIKCRHFTVSVALLIKLVRQRQYITYHNSGHYTISCLLWIM
jgi:hypothetical protein